MTEVVAEIHTPPLQLTKIDQDIRADEELQDIENLLGMVVHSEDEAYNLYNDYAIRIEFSVRKEKLRYAKNGVRQRESPCVRPKGVTNARLKSNLGKRKRKLLKDVTRSKQLSTRGLPTSSSHAPKGLCQPKHPSSVPMDESYTNQVFLPPAMPTTISPSHFQHPNQNPFSYWSSVSPNFNFRRTAGSCSLLEEIRYKEAFNDQSLYNRNSGGPKPVQQLVAGPWQIILKITGARCNRTKRCSFAHEAVNMQGVCVFFGVASSAARSKGGVMLEAMVDAAIRAKHHGFQYILFLGDDRRVVQAFRMKRSTDWLDNTRLADLNILAQSGLFYRMGMNLKTKTQNSHDHQIRYQNRSELVGFGSNLCFSAKMLVERDFDLVAKERNDTGFVENLSESGDLFGCG
ncbi:hypothetical protein CMV_001525 [Castanea mollissima]|uniref:Uncharacterized protein n=1 Tax=Castanea mollissima TaxID=60419 RepID=A0A8J4RXI5_9ROSI|nr:hypothetical protein CMV_001525 [Castanea mollissima]